MCEDDNKSDYGLKKPVASSLTSFPVGVFGTSTGEAHTFASSLKTGHISSEKNNK